MKSALVKCLFFNEWKFTCFCQEQSLPHLTKEAMQIFVHGEVIVWKEQMNLNPVQLERLVMFWVSSINFQVSFTITSFNSSTLEL